MAQLMGIIELLSAGFRREMLNLREPSCFTDLEHRWRDTRDNEVPVHFQARLRHVYVISCSSNDLRAQVLVTQYFGVMYVMVHYNFIL